MSDLDQHVASSNGRYVCNSILTPPQSLYRRRRPFPEILRPIPGIPVASRCQSKPHAPIRPHRPHPRVVLRKVLIEVDQDRLQNLLCAPLGQRHILEQVVLAQARCKVIRRPDFFVVFIFRRVGRGSGSGSGSDVDRDAQSRAGSSSSCEFASKVSSGLRLPR